MKYIAYYRVSTKRQGLGLDAQKASVDNFIQKENDATLIAEYSEKESGKDDERLELNKALHRCQKEGAILLIAKLDRLSRNCAFLFALYNGGVNFRALDLPEFNILTLAIFSGLAQYERELISTRTKLALAALKAKGVKLGAPNPVISPEAHKRAVEAIKAKASGNMNNLKSVEAISKYLAQHRTQKVNYSQIARYLSREGIYTAKDTEHTAMSVRRLILRYNLV